MRLQGRWRLNLILLLIIIGLGAVVVFKPGKHIIEKPSILNLDVAAVTSIRLDNGEKMQFRRLDGGWRLTEPFDAPVNAARVEQLLSVAALKPAHEYPLADHADLKSYGLVPPMARLELDGQTLEFGSVAPLDRRRYVRVSSQLYLVDDSFSHQLVSKSTDFIDKKLLPESTVVRGIAIPGLTITRTPEGRWTSQSSMTADQLQDFVMQWSTARAIEVRRGAPFAPGEVIVIETADQPIRFNIFQKGPELILGRTDENLLYVMTAETSRLLLNLPKPALDPRLFPRGLEEEPGNDPSEDRRGHEPHDHDHDDEE